MSKQNVYYVYILTNKANSVLYIGVTNDLLRRIEQHRTGSDISSFTKKYHVEKLVYYETTEDVYAAISREKQLKGGSRKAKIRLIEEMNPDWADLSEKL